MSNYVMLYKTDKVEMNKIYSIKDIYNLIVTDIHGEYDNHKDKLNLSKVYKKYSDNAVIKIVNTTTICRRNIQNSDKLVFVGKICKIRTYFNILKSKVLLFISELRASVKHPLFWFGIFLIFSGVTQFLINFI